MTREPLAIALLVAIHLAAWALIYALLASGYQPHGGCVAVAR